MAQTESVRIEIPIETLDKTEPEISNLVKKLSKVSKAEKDMGRSTESANKSVSKFDRTASKTARTLNRLTKGRYRVMLEAKDRIAPILTSLGSRLRNFTRKSWRVTIRAADYATRPIRGILRLLKSPLLAAGGILGVGIGVKDAIETRGEFQAQMSKVQAISGLDTSTAKGAEQMEKLTQKAKEMGAATKFTSTEAGEAMQYMAMAGWKSEQMMEGLEGIMNLAAASGEKLGTTSDIVTDALTAFKLEAKDSTHFADVLAAASSNSNTNVAMMGETFKYAANSAGALGFNIEDTALAIGLMANTGLKSSMAGTALKQIIDRLSNSGSAASKRLNEMGIEFYDAAGKAKPLGEIMDAIRKQTKGFNDEQMKDFTSLFGQRGGNGMTAILQASKKSYKDLKKAIDDADGSAEKMSDTMLDNMSGALTYLQSAVYNLKEELGERFEPYVVGVAHWIKDEIPNIEKGLNGFMDKFDEKVNSIKSKMTTLMNGNDWKNADFFGKIKLSWNKLISEPFAEWWKNGGRKSLADKLAGVGEGIGKAMNAGILTLLGFDATGVFDEASSVGMRFAKGFADGFDFGAIKEKLWDGIKNLFADAAKLLPGGEEAGLSSLLSAGLLYKLFSPLVKGGKGLFSAGKGIAGAVGSIFGKGGAAAAGGAMASGAATAATDAGWIALTEEGLVTGGGAAAAAGGGGLLSSIGAGITGTVGLPALAVGGTAAGLLYGVAKQEEANMEANIADRQAAHMRGKSDNVDTLIAASKSAAAVSEVYGENMGTARQVRVNRDFWKSSQDLAEAEKKWAEENKEYQKLREELSQKLKDNEICQDAYNDAIGRELAKLSEGATAIEEMRAAHADLRAEKQRESEVEQALTELLDEGVISQKKYDNALDEGLRSDKSAQQVVEDVLTSKKKYKEIMDSLTASMDAAKIPTEQQKAVLGELRQKYLESGGNLKEFKQIVKDCGDDVMALAQAINDIPATKKIEIIPGLPSNISFDLATGNVTSGSGKGGKGVKGGKNKKTDHKAAGGYVSGGPRLSWLAEEGYGEYVIPTNPGRRSRALELWKQAGDALGVSKFAAGGFVGGLNSAFRSLGNNLYPHNARKEFSGTQDANSTVPVLTPVMATAGTSPNVSINVTLTPTFNMDGSSGNVIDGIRAEMNTIANEVAGNIAERLNPIFLNMPAESED